MPDGYFVDKQVDKLSFREFTQYKFSKMQAYTIAHKNNIKKKYLWNGVGNIGFPFFFIVTNGALQIKALCNQESQVAVSFPSGSCYTGCLTSRNNSGGVLVILTFHQHHNKSVLTGLFHFVC